MEHITPEQKQPIVRGLAITGLVAIIIFLAWLAIQIVNILPAALTSLASLANSVYNYNPLAVRSIDVTTNQEFLDVDSPLTLSWSKPKVAGVYTFSYSCENKIALTLKTPSTEFVDTTCGQIYELKDSEEVTISLDEKAEVNDFGYTLAFFRTNASTPTAEHKGRISLVNSSTEVVTADTPTTGNSNSMPTIPTTTGPELVPSDQEIIVTIQQPETTVEVVTPSTTTVATAPVKPKPVTTQSTPTFIYAIPTSQPNGSADLAVTILGIGQYTNNTFVKNSEFLRNRNNAVQFSVHNIGNKTSKTWTFSVELPGVDYTSTKQLELKPNERAVITAAFGNITSRASNLTLETSVVTNDDANIGNNSRSSTVSVK